MDSSGPGHANLTYYEAGAAAQDLLLEAKALGLDAGTAAGMDMAGPGPGLKLPAGTQMPDPAAGGPGEERILAPIR